jgi:hypothetical protein
MLWITVGAIAAAVLVVGGGGALAFAQYKAPGNAATQFCTDLKTQSYSMAYDLLSAGQQTQFSRDQFVQGSQTLDQVEGTVVSCQLANTSGAYGYRLGSGSATLATVVTRAKVGSLRGAVHLKSESGAWKIDGVDTSLLGVNLHALQTAGAFCAAMQGQSYTTAYALLDNAAQAAVTQDAFVQAAQAHDQIDGAITACQLIALGNANTDANASLMVSITRAKLGQRMGTMSLDVQAGAWKIATISPELQGTDLGPLQVGLRMCADLLAGNYAAVYDLTSSGFQANVARAQVVTYFTVPSPLKYASCKPDLTTYKVSGDQASYDFEITLVDTSTGQVLGFPFTLYFVDENGAWKLDGIAPKQGGAGSNSRPSGGTGSFLSSSRLANR